MLLRALIAIPLVALAGCGSSKSEGSSGGDAGTCIAVNSDSFCGANFPCCSGGWCDNITGYCRAQNDCGVSGQGCDADHPCCSGIACSSQGQCATEVHGASTGGSGGSSTGSTGGCQPMAAVCNTGADCCSGFCATGNHLCGSAPTTGGSGGTTTGGTTSGGGTCFGAGTSCSSGTQCCSGRCNSGICG